MGLTTFPSGTFHCLQNAILEDLLQICDTLPSSPLQQLGVEGSAVNSPSGSRVEPQPIMILMHSRQK